MMEADNKPKDKYELREYLLEIDLKDSEALEARADEIVGSIFEAMGSYKHMPGDHPLKTYYDTPFREIELGYALKDFKKLFPYGIKHLLVSINWE